jgi:hypothetical protein
MIHGNQNEYYDGGDPDYDYEKMNRQMLLELNQNNNKGKTNEIKNDENLTTKSNLSTKIDEEDSKQLNPISEFFRIKKEIDSIEKDIKFYNEHKDLFKDPLSYKKSMEELKKIKEAANFIYNDEKFKKFRKNYINNSQILNMKMTEKLNEHLLNRIEIISKLKSDYPELYSNIDYKLILTNDNIKNKRKIQIEKIKNKIKEIELKIGKIENKNKEETLTKLVLEIKRNLSLFDNNFLNDLDKAMNNLKDNLNENLLNQELHKMKPRIDEMYNLFNENFQTIKEIEDIISNTISKMESNKNNHEEKAYIMLKIKDVTSQQEKIGVNIDENIQLLDELKNNIKSNCEIMKKNINILNDKIKK